MVQLTKESDSRTIQSKTAEALPDATQSKTAKQTRVVFNNYNNKLYKTKDKKTTTQAKLQTNLVIPYCQTNSNIQTVGRTKYKFEFQQWVPMR